MPLDPAARAFLDAIGKFPQPQDITVQEFRDQATKLLGALPKPGPIKRMEDVTIRGGDGQDLKVRLYVPESARPLPVAVWTRGGSFTRTTLDMLDGMRVAFANACGLIVAAVDQRLSPEATFPAPLEDGYAAAVWVADHAAEFGGDPKRVGVGGESSGGNLAAALALLARKRGKPKLAFQILMAPILDASCSMPSVDEFAEGYGLTKGQLLWAYEQYAPRVPRENPLLSPLKEADLTGLPPAVILSIEYDPARDEAEAYARRLAEAGVPVRHARIDGMVHHFSGSAAVPTVVKLTREMLEER